MADVKTVVVSQPTTEAIKAAIAAGDILVSPALVKIKEINTNLQYQKHTPVNLAGAVALAGAQDQVPNLDKDGNQTKDADGNLEWKRGESVVGLFAYGHDLVIRSSVRTKYLNDTAAPEKKREAQIKNLMKMGYDEATATAIVMNAPNVQATEGSDTDEAAAE